MESNIGIETYPGFCSKCGSILPSLSMEEFIKCYSCKTVFGSESKYPNNEHLFLLSYDFNNLILFMPHIRL